MNQSEIRNPVTAMAESDATGEVAEIFADIRETMEIPLITSIWRILVDIEGGLRSFLGCHQATLPNRPATSHPLENSSRNDPTDTQAYYD